MIVSYQITTIFYVFDECCTLPKNETNSLPYINIFLDNLKSCYPYFDDLDHNVVFSPRLGNEYLECYGLQRFKTRKSDSDWSIYEGVYKDVALLKYFSSGFFDQENNYRFFIKHPFNTFRPTPQWLMMDLKNRLFSFAQCLVVFITSDNKRGPKLAKVLMNSDRANIINIAPIIRSRMNGMEQKEKVLYISSEIAKSFSSHTIVPSQKPSAFSSEVTINGVNPKFVEFGFIDDGLCSIDNAFN